MYKKLYRMTPLNLEIKRVEAIIYKTGKCSPTMKSYLDGLKNAKRLIDLREQTNEKNKLHE